MCSGPGFSLINVGDEERIFTKNYRCTDCDKTFKGFGIVPVCPQCKSKNVRRIK